MLPVNLKPALANPYLVQNATRFVMKKLAVFGLTQSPMAGGIQLTEEKLTGPLHYQMKI